MKKPKKPPSANSNDEQGDLFGHSAQDRASGEAAAVAHTDPGYVFKWHEVGDRILEDPGFKGIASQMITGLIGPPTRAGKRVKGKKSNAVPALMGALVRRHPGLVNIATIKSPYNLQTRRKDKRHGHPLRIWGYPEEEALFKADRSAWVAAFWEWWHEHFAPGSRLPRAGVKVNLVL